jgi:hypothetical protein
VLPPVSLDPYRIVRRPGSAFYAFADETQLYNLRALAAAVPVMSFSEWTALVAHPGAIVGSASVFVIFICDLFCVAP